MESVVSGKTVTLLCYALGRLIVWSVGKTVISVLRTLSTNTWDWDSYLIINAMRDQPVCTSATPATSSRISSLTFK